MNGQTIGHYEILEKLGEGGMGVVYKARDVRLNRSVALKLMPTDKVADEDRLRRFTQEAHTASALNHPNIVTIHDIGTEGRAAYIVMEYVAGKTLDQLIPRKGMRLAEVLKIAVQVADALAAAAAAGVIHRDVKPGNVMMTESGLVKVLDFGLAKLADQAASPEQATATMMDAERPRTREGTIIGTVSYMSPEQRYAPFRGGALSSAEGSGGRRRGDTNPQLGLPPGVDSRAERDLVHACGETAGSLRPSAASASSRAGALPAADTTQRVLDAHRMRWLSLVHATDAFGPSEPTGGLGRFLGLPFGCRFSSLFSGIGWTRTPPNVH
jgi:serine/threonine protein kinase